MFSDRTYRQTKYGREKTQGEKYRMKRNIQIFHNQVCLSCSEFIVYHGKCNTLYIKNRTKHKQKQIKNKQNKQTNKQKGTIYNHITYPDTI